MCGLKKKKKKQIRMRPLLDLSSQKQKTTCEQKLLQGLRGPKKLSTKTFENC